MIQNSDGTFVEADEACPDGYVQEGDLDWILWNECTKVHAPTSVGTLRSRRRADERGTDECSADERGTDECSADERGAVETIAIYTEETLMAEHDVDEDVQQMFKKAHHVVFNHNLTESQCAALQKYYAWIRSTWCRRYQLIVNSGSEDREEETRARQEQKAKLAAMQAKMDQLVAAATVRPAEASRLAA
ncbi:unnamed protein product [Tilletia laevis]|nr:unnamed protein product [Tilletia laevis]